MLNKPTPTLNSVPFRPANFSSLVEALDYAAQGDTGTNFYSGKGELYAALSYARLREEAIAIAQRLLGLGLEKGDRVALVAETHPDFLSLFFGCQYAGMVPVALPIVANLSGHSAYVEHLRGLLENCDAKVVASSPEFLTTVEEASRNLDIRFTGDVAKLSTVPAADVELPTITPDDVAYIQYTSGSTCFPRGVVITQRSVMSNLGGIVRDGLKLRESDRFLSWLPFYHDMGMVGLVLVPMASQTSVDYLETREFVKRPRMWLRLMSETGATISFSPAFGYQLCMSRLRPGQTAEYDLSRWRIAGVGAEMIRPVTLERFSRALKDSGFNKKSFLSCYGMAEASLAISFAPLESRPQTDWVDIEQIARCGRATPINNSTPESKVKGFMLCGKPLPEYDVEIRGEQGEVLQERNCGVIYVRGQSVMSGYYNAPDKTAETLSSDGWLDTGDLGYMVDEQLVIIGRKKDLIIINGRNISPQDIEYVAEKQPEIRLGDALAFAVPASDDSETSVLVVEYRETDAEKRTELRERLSMQIRQEIGVDCFVELVPINTLPSTSSGKPSRSKARLQFLERIKDNEEEAQEAVGARAIESVGTVESVGAVGF